MFATESATSESGPLVPIQELCDGAVTFRTEGERRFIHMEGLHFTVSGASKVMDALLCLNHDNPTYPTKLYLPEKVGTGLNWNETAAFLNRAWHTWSWRDVSPDQSPVEILAGHLAAFEPVVK